MLCQEENVLHISQVINKHVFIACAVKYQTVFRYYFIADVFSFFTCVHRLKVASSVNTLQFSVFFSFFLEKFKKTTVTLN